MKQGKLVEKQIKTMYILKERGFTNAYAYEDFYFRTNIKGQEDGVQSRYPIWRT